MDQTFQVILIGALLVLFAIVAGRVSSRLGAPVLLVFLGLGMLAGEDGLGLRYDDVSGAFFVCSVALAVILFDSGLRTQTSTIRLAGAPALMLATMGVGLTAGLVAVAAWVAFDTTPVRAFLIGAVVASTDAAAVFFLLRLQKLEIARRVTATLEVESGLNDPMAIFLTLLAVSLLKLDGAHAGVDFAAALLDFALQMGGGAAIGLIGGGALVWLVNRLEVEAGLYPVLVVVGCLALFAGAQLIHASGFLAVYLAGLTLGNQRHRGSQLILRFHDGLAWLAQIAMLVILGLLVNPGRLIPVLIPATIIALVLVFVARPVAVFLCLWPFRFTAREKAFAAWVGLRGAVPIYLALPAILEKLPQAQTLFGVAFVVVLVSLALQGWTVAPVARFLNLALPPRAEAAARRDVDVPVGADRDIVGYTVLPGSVALTRNFGALTLPQGARILAILRQGTVLEGTAAERLQPRDYVLIVVDPEGIHELDRIFAPRRLRREPGLAAIGEFMVDGGQKIADLGRLYGIDIAPKHAEMTIAQVIGREFSGHPVAGDRISYGPVELIVRTLDDHGAIAGVGLELESEAERPTLARLVGPRGMRLLGPALGRLGRLVGRHRKA